MFDYKPEDYETVHVWRSRNPLNGLEYGYGGVKLLPKQLTMKIDTTTTDMTMNISSKFKVVDEVSNITAFDTDAFSTWRSAFRECCKLSVINNEESLLRLGIWCMVANGEFGDDAIDGALAGKEYGQNNAADPAALSKINDFNWLKEQYEEMRSSGIFPQ
jgi:hypothetical protein